MSQNYLADREEIEAWATENKLQVVWTDHKYTGFAAINDRIFDAEPGEQLIPRLLTKPK